MTFPSELDPRWNAPILDVYGPADLRPDGYPIPWASPTATELAPLRGYHSPSWPPIKDLIRELTGHRCIRCLHPYVVGRSSVMAAPPIPERYVENTLQLWEERGAPDAEELEDDGLEAVTGARPILYSACDEQCRHGGPVRIRYVGPPWPTLNPEPNRDWHDRGADFDGPAGPLLGHRYEVQAAFRILTVHHLTGDKADCRWWNLTALCQRCHLSVQTRVQMDHPWPWEHSEWFKPYVAGYYAWKYEGRSITRAEALTDMDRLLELERGRYELRAGRGTKGARR